MSVRETKPPSFHNGQNPGAKCRVMSAERREYSQVTVAEDELESVGQLSGKSAEAAFSAFIATAVLSLPDNRLAITPRDIAGSPRARFGRLSVNIPSVRFCGYRWRIAGK
jgi:hypothetical protein